MKELKRNHNGDISTLDGSIIKAEKVSEENIKLSLLGYLATGNTYKKTCIESQAPKEANSYLIKSFQDLGLDLPTADRILHVNFYKI